MSIISESLAADKAKDLEKILFDAVQGPYWSDARSAIKGFCKKNIWPLYVAESNDSYGLHRVNQELKQIFEPQ